MGWLQSGTDFTAAAVTAENVTVKTSIQFESGYDYSSLKTAIEDKAKEYLHSLSKTWEESNNLTVHISRLESAVLDVKGIADITETTLNGASANLVLDADAIPIFSTMEVTTIE